MTDMNGAEPATDRPLVCHIPVCPFSQRLEILLALKGMTGAVGFHVVDITRPRPDWLLERTGGSTAMPILLTPGGGVLKESLIILRYLEELFPDPTVARRDPFERAVERMLIAHEGAFTTCGYRFVMNRDPSARDRFVGRCTKSMQSWTPSCAATILTADSCSTTSDWRRSCSPRCSCGSGSSSTMRTSACREPASSTASGVGATPALTIPLRNRSAVSRSSSLLRLRARCRQRCAARRACRLELRLRTALGGTALASEREVRSRGN